MKYLARNSLLVLLSMLLGIMVVACAPPADAPAEEPAAADEAEAEAPAEEEMAEEDMAEEEPAAEGMDESLSGTVTIAYNQFFEMTFGPGAPPIEAIQTEVAKVYPNIEVKLNVMPSEVGPWRDNYTIWFQAEDGTADLLGVGIYWVPEFAENEFVLPLNDIVDPEIVADLNPAYVDAFSYNDTLVALGPWWGGVGGIYYRTDLLEEAGLEPPTTYEELVSIATTLQAENPDLAGWTWPALKDQVLINRWVEFLNGHGGQYFDDAGNCVMNNEQGVAALDFMISLMDEGITPREALTWKEEDSQVRFASGTAIFHTGRNDMTFWLDNPEQSEVVENWAFIPMPAAEGGTPSGFFEGWGFGINRYSDNPEAAAAVLEVMFDFPVQKEFNLSQGPLQAHVEVYSDPDVIENNPNMEMIGLVADTAAAPIPSPVFADISVILQDELHSALSGLISSQEALDNACEAIADL